MQESPTQSQPFVFYRIGIMTMPQLSEFILNCYGLSKKNLNFALHNGVSEKCSVPGEEIARRQLREPEKNNVPN